MQEDDLISKVFEEAVLNDLVKRVSGLNGGIIENKEGIYSLELKQSDDFTYTIITNLENSDDTFRYFEVFQGFFQGPCVEKYEGHNLENLIRNIHDYLMQDLEILGKSDKKVLYGPKKD
ncbi:hypothetical protein KY321_05740 [Candidatus Woesearchaeota archaeon]|nr:hypothetical protein [Candidatus Woesearchaeota archaeon]